MRTVLFLLAWFNSVWAYAYVDPGTGATLVGSLSPLVIALAVAVLLFIIKLLWRPLMGLLRGKEADNEGDEE